MLEPATLALIAIFALAGFVKGVIGLGLPTVSLALLSILFELPAAMALLLVPSLVTNLWQAAAGAHLQSVLARIWPFLLLATLTIGLGAHALQRIELTWLSALLGLLLVAYAAAELGGLRLSISAARAKPAGALLGIANGLLTGMTGSFVVPGVMYLQAIGLGREALIQAMGLLFALSTLALALALHGIEMLTPQQLGASTVGLLPALAGMELGRRLRQKLPQALFRRVFFSALIALGSYILVTALAGMIAAG